MKKKIQYLLIAFTLLAFVSCKKKSDTVNPTTPTDYTSQFSTQSDDVTRVTNETNAIEDDADAALESSPSMGGRIESPICDGNISYSVDTNVTVVRTLTITYSGITCDSLRERTGTVTISMPANTRWRDTGAAVTITFNVTITRLSDNKKLTIAGTKVYTNVDGGLLRNLATRNTIVHTVTSPGITVTFDDGTTRAWNIAKQRTYTYNGGNIEISLTGTYSSNNNNGIYIWGINRAGNAFSTATTQPIVAYQDCDYRIASGVVTHLGLNYSVTVTYGLDSKGNPTTCPGKGQHYFYEISWTIAGKTSTAILPY